MAITGGFTTCAIWQSGSKLLWGFRFDDLLKLISCWKVVMHKREAKFSSYLSSYITSVCLYLSFTM